MALYGFYEVITNLIFMKNLINRAFFGVLFVCLLVAGYYFFSSQSLPIEEVQNEEVRNENTNNFYFLPSVPDEITFAGEKVPVHHIDVYESLDRELLVNSHLHSQTFRILKLAPRYFSVIDPILKANDIPLDFRYVAVAESGLNPRAISSAGAVGIWQFMKGTATQYGLEVSTGVDERYHLEKATRAACRYLKDSYAKFGNWTMVAASYNAGVAGMNRHISAQNESSYYDLLLVEETSRYIFRILALKMIMEDPESFGYKVDEKYPLYKTTSLSVDTTIADLAVFAKLYNTNYKMLKTLNPWLRSNNLTVAKGKSYTILLPVKGSRDVQ